jgi:hypothetical protein
MPKKIRKDEPINTTSSGRKIRGDMKAGDIKRKRQDGITKKEFFAILDKASQPIKHEAESDSGKSET